ncbi:hypothetical protein [Amycolatopsis sp. NBC_01480]|uniref:hypothetical protein n=1 Tax=Amycolatopsis sp. NBC_01480 TaxID=2903562 RepID=UPI002E2E77ED|nr:hypothetical protein [Amycolatopsis sp. NBC_01480]
MMVDKAVALAAEFVKEGSPWLLRRKIRKNIRADSRSYSDALLDRISLLDYPEKRNLLRRYRGFQGFLDQNGECLSELPGVTGIDRGEREECWRIKLASIRGCQRRSDAGYVAYS